MMLSIVFLLMFVASSLRNGSAGFQQQQEYKRLVQKAEDLEQQIKAYNTLKDEALKRQTSQTEQDVYKKLMDRLDLLKDDAHNEKTALQKKAKENEEKEFALNQYQQLIRNIINANVLANTQINRRDLIIVSKDATIEEKKQKIAEMERVVADNQAQIQSINQQLDTKIVQLTAEQQRSQSSKAELQQRIALLRKQTDEKVRSLQSKSQDISNELTLVRGTLMQTETRLTAAQTENTNLAQKLESDSRRYKAELASLESQHKAKLAAERAAFENGLKNQRLSAALRAKKLQAFLANEKGKATALEGRLSGSVLWRKKTTPLRKKAERSPRQTPSRMISRKPVPLPMPEEYLPKKLAIILRLPA
ncbi:MAG: hypothetical protein HY074_10375 [Deltaproteobacteria bacterium]|nr:hypothetical protein [Deltaproteobacteria bacterium]